MGVRQGGTLVLAPWNDEKPASSSPGEKTGIAWTSSGAAPALTRVGRTPPFRRAPGRFLLQNSV